MPPAMEAWDHDQLDSWEAACSPDSPASLLSSLSLSHSLLTILSLLAPSNKSFET